MFNDKTKDQILKDHTDYKQGGAIHLVGTCFQCLYIFLNVELKQTERAFHLSLSCNYFVTNLSGRMRIRLGPLHWFDDLSFVTQPTPEPTPQPPSRLPIARCTCQNGRPSGYNTPAGILFTALSSIIHSNKRHQRCW